MNEDKKLLDLSGLQRYDGKIKEFIENAIEEKEVTSITNEEVEELFEEEAQDPNHSGI